MCREQLAIPKAPLLEDGTSARIAKMVSRNRLICQDAESFMFDNEDRSNRRHHVLVASVVLAARMLCVLEE
jgi:hypothetical protein